MMHPDTTAMDAPVYSEFADDPDFGDLLHLFIESLHKQRSEILSLFQDRQWDGLHSMAHQIKGAAGGYGFPQLTEKAYALETAAGEKNEAEIAIHLEDLLTYMARLSA